LRITKSLCISIANFSLIIRSIICISMFKNKKRFDFIIIIIIIIIIIVRVQYFFLNKETINK